MRHLARTRRKGPTLPKCQSETDAPSAAIITAMRTCATLLALIVGAMTLVGASAPERTRITSQKDAVRLARSKGVTLQWIDWNTRGAVFVRRGALWHLTGAQAQAGGPGRLYLDGNVTEIGKGFFTFRGTIRLTDTPDVGRRCEATRDWHFAVTQNRPYYRLREFEWCDGLTDYVDVHF